VSDTAKDTAAIAVDSPGPQLAEVARRISGRYRLPLSFVF